MVGGDVGSVVVGMEVGSVVVGGEVGSVVVGGEVGSFVVGGEVRSIGDSQGVHFIMRTCPELVLPLPLFIVAPIATIVPSFDIDTEIPDRSFGASPSNSARIAHEFCCHSYTRT